MLMLTSYVQLLNPAVNSLSYLAILDLLQDVNAASPEQRATATINFYTSFDPRQIRYAGQMFTNCLKTMISGTFPLPVSRTFCQSLFLAVSMLIMSQFSARGQSRSPHEGDPQN